MNAITKIFLASSYELKSDRDVFEQFIGRENKVLHQEGITLELVIWEDFIDVISQTRLQDEYNKAIRGCDIFVMLYHTKVGKYTAEEFSIAFGQFKTTNRPQIFTYYKTAKVSLSNISREHYNSLMDFQEMLLEKGHFHTQYEHSSELAFHFSRQLKKLINNGYIKSNFNERREGSKQEKKSTFDQKVLDLDIRPLEPIDLVNCDRVEKNKKFWKDYFKLDSEQMPFQFNLISACTTQVPKSFSERIIMELIEYCEDQDEAIMFHQKFDSSRIKIHPLPLSKAPNLDAHKNKFCKFLTNELKFNFPLNVGKEDSFFTNVSKLQYSHIAIPFEIIEEDWDDDLKFQSNITIQYIEWIIKTFSQFKDVAPKFIFFFVFYINGLHNQTRLSKIQQFFKNTLDELQNKYSNTIHYSPLMPVKDDDIVNWFKKLGEDNPSKSKEVIDSFTEEQLKPHQIKYKDGIRLLDMADIERMQEQIEKIKDQ